MEGLAGSCEKGLPQGTALRRDAAALHHAITSRLTGNAADLVTVKEPLGLADTHAHSNREVNESRPASQGGSDKLVTLPDPGPKPARLAS